LPVIEKQTMQHKFRVCFS